MKTLRIRNWEGNFENSSSRKLKRLDWVAIPNRMDGAGYTALVDHPNGAAHLGAWLAMVEIASRQGKDHTERGAIPRGSGGICQTLGRISRLSGGIFQEAIPRLMAIGWVEQVIESEDVPDSLDKSADEVAESADVMGESADEVAAQEGKEGNGREGEGRGANPRTPVPIRAPSPDYQPRIEVLYAAHSVPGFKQDGTLQCLEILSTSVNPETVMTAIERAHAEWMAHFAANPTEWQPGFGRWFSDGYYLRRPKAREPTSFKTKQQLQADAWDRA